MIAALGFIWSQKLSTDPAEVPLPRRAAGLALSRETYGAAAIQEINQLHNLAFPLVTGAVGEFGAGPSVVLWVSGAEDENAAAQLLADMREKIDLGRSPFKSLGENLDGARVVYLLEGLGQRHYYFQSGNLLVWLAADRGLAEEALAEALDFYP